MGCLTAEMIVLLPVVRVLVLLPPLHGVSLGLRLMIMMEWNWFQKLKRSKKIPQRTPESMFGAMPETFGGEYNCLFGDNLWEDPHCCTAYTQAESLDKEAQEEDMHLFAPMVALVQQNEKLYTNLNASNPQFLTFFNVLALCQFGHALDLYLPMVKVVDLHPEDLLMTAEMVVSSASADDCAVL
nr:uncharacterized protein LOC111993429 [Quercus suber]